MKLQESYDDYSVGRKQREAAVRTLSFTSASLATFAAGVISRYHVALGIAAFACGLIHLRRAAEYYSDEKHPEARMEGVAALAHAVAAFACYHFSHSEYQTGHQVRGYRDKVTGAVERWQRSRSGFLLP